jgi:hypothetical protein
MEADCYPSETRPYRQHCHSLWREAAYRFSM